MHFFLTFLFFCIIKYSTYINRNIEGVIMSIADKWMKDVDDIDQRLDKINKSIEKSNKKVAELQALMGKLKKNQITPKKYEQEFQKIMRKYK